MMGRLYFRLSLMREPAVLQANSAAFYGLALESHIIELYANAVATFLTVMISRAPTPFGRGRAQKNARSRAQGYVASSEESRKRACRKFYSPQDQAYIKHQILIKLKCATRKCLGVKEIARLGTLSSDFF